METYMDESELVTEENELIDERFALSMERIKEIAKENIVKAPFHDYFKQVAEFISLVDEIKSKREQNWFQDADLEALQQVNTALYQDILEENYEKSYGNPAYAVKVLGEEYGQLLCFLYAEIRGDIVYAYENRIKEFTIHNELFIEVYNLFEDAESLSPEGLKQILYYFVSDYSDVFVTNRIREQLDPSLDFAAKIVMESDLTDVRYLYRYGEYIQENEIQTAQYLASLSQEEIEKMAATYTNGFKEGFQIARIDLSKKKSVNIRYAIGQERMVRAAILQFEKMDLKPVIFRASVNRVNKKGVGRIGYTATSPNRQYEFDHRQDEALFLDKAFVDRKLGVMKSAYEEYKTLAKEYAGPAVIEVFGEKNFEPINKEESILLNSKQQKLSVQLATKSSQIVNTYIARDDYSFTIIAYPVPEIGDNFQEIFQEIVKVNTLDNGLYREMQQVMIDELNLAKAVRVKGSGNNKTDIVVAMQTLKDPATQTNFENCLADVNIPVGEVFTSPKLTGTNGILNVSEVYLNELKYKDLTLTFQDGKIIGYTCDNFKEEAENQAFIKENLLFNHETLPIGEFAIGTNTTAYVMAHQYDIVYKLPILIAEKMGPHFAVGDTCYSYSEENRLFNPDGKEIVAKENECSALRKEDISKAYFNCHTDITIPYDELESIVSIHEDGKEVPIILNGRFVLPGTEQLNEPFQ